MKSLEQYLRENNHNRVIDHAIRATVTNDKVKFYIHPINANGSTLDFEAKGNTLIPIANHSEDKAVNPSALTISNLEKCFYEASCKDKKYVGIRIQMEGFPKDEIIINENANFDSKFDYYKKTYDEQLNHRHAKGIRIVGFTYGDTFADIEQDLIKAK